MIVHVNQANVWVSYPSRADVPLVTEINKENVHFELGSMHGIKNAKKEK